METNVKNIENVKALKLGEEKSDKKEIKQLQNRIKAAENKDAKLRLEFNNLERKTPLPLPRIAKT